MATDFSGKTALVTGAGRPSVNPVTALELAGWRRATAALYAQVRNQADPRPGTSCGGRGGTG